MALDLSYATGMGEEVDAQLLAAAEYRRLSYPKWLGPPGLIADGLPPLLAFLPMYLHSLWPLWIDGQPLSTVAERYFTAVLWPCWAVPIVLAPVFIRWRRQAAMRRRLGAMRPALRFGPVPTELRLGPEGVEIASLGRRLHWPHSFCVSLIETTAQFVLLLDDAVVPIPKQALDWPQRGDFRAWASAAGLTPRYVATPPRHRTVIAVSVVLLASIIAIGYWATRLAPSG